MRELRSTPEQASAASLLSLDRASLLSQRHSWADLLAQSSKVEVSAEPRAALYCLLDICPLSIARLRYTYGALEVVGGAGGHGTGGQDRGSEEVTHCEIWN